MSLPLPPGDETERFEDALVVAQTGHVLSEWPFPDPVLDALYAVAAGPSQAHVDAARAAFRAASNDL